MNNAISQQLAFLNESQIECIKSIVRDGAWGNTDLKFNDGKIYLAYGYFTNQKKRKEWSGKLSGISKKIKASGTNFIVMHSDWWGDGSGDMMFFNMEMISTRELNEWANQ